MMNVDKHFMHRLIAKLIDLLPLMLFVVMVAAGYATYRHFQNLEDDAIQDLSSKRLDSFNNQLAQAVDDRIKSVQRMAGRLQYSKHPDRDAWLADAGTYRSHLKGLDSVAVFDVSGKMKWISAQSEKTEAELRALDSQILADTIAEARARGSFTISHRLPLEGSAAFLLVVPLVYRNESVGSLVSIHRLEPFLKSFYKLDGYQLQIRENREILFSNIDLSATHVQEWGARAKYPLVNQVWNFELAPTPTTIKAHRTNLPNIVLLGSILTAALLSAILHLVLRLRQRSRAVEQQRLFLDTVIDHLPVAVFCNDHENGMKFSVWNKKSEELFGVSKEKIIGKTIAQVFPGAKMRTLSPEPTPHGLGENGAVSFEERIISKRGVSLLLETQKLTVADLVGRTQYSLGISEDISERRAAEIRLTDSEKKFASFMDNTPELSWIRNAKGEITFANTQFLKVFGVDNDSVIGQSWIPGLGSSTHKAGAETDALVLKNRENMSSVRTTRMADGSTKHFLVMKFPMTLSGADYIGATAIDISDRIEAENTLADMTKTLKALIDSSPLPILTLDLTGKVKIWSPACEKIFGWTATEVIGRPLPFVPAEFRSESQQIISKIIAAGAPGFATEATRVRKDGSRLEMRIDGKVLNDEKTGQPTGLVAVMTDISNRKIAEKQLQEAKEAAETTMRMKTEFLANVSHEIRTPLNGIIGMTDILMESGLTEEQKKYATIVQNSGSILLNLINDVLDMSKMDAGKMELEQTPFALVSLVETHADLLIAKAREKSLSLMTYVDSNLPPQVSGDPGRIGQVVVNLIGNALKFTNKGGVSVRVLRERSHASDSPTSVRVVFEVQDTGIGLSHASQQKLFLPFSQAESSTTRRFGGTGLGLSISKNLVEAMGGQIGVQSREGEGATFWFSIPLEVYASKKTGLQNLPSAIESARVLIVDEDTVASDIVPRYLRSWGLVNVEHATPEKALQNVIESHSRGFPYQLVLVGQGRNATTSQRFAKDVNYAMGAASPKLILMTPFESQLMASSRLGDDFAAIISKPIKQSHLFDCIVRVLINQPTSLTAPVAEPEVEIRRPSSAVIGLRILVADDVSTNQIIAVKLLDSLGHFGHSVGNGQEAIEALALHPYDIVLMDCQMPVMDGYEATRALRASKDPRVANTTVIALTANAMEGDKQRCIDAGMNDYLAKPIKKDKLAEVLARWTPAMRKTA